MELKELMNKVKSTAQSVGSKATELGKSWVSSTKINFRLMELKSQIDADYKAAGKLLYAVHGGEEIDPDAIEELMSEIDGKMQEVESLRDQLKSAKAAPEPVKSADAVCPVCGKPVSSENAYCPTCGTKLDLAEKAEEIQEEICEKVEEAQEAAEEVREAVEEKAEAVKEAVEETFEEVGEVVEKSAEQAEKKFESFVDDIIKEKNE